MSKRAEIFELLDVAFETLTAKGKPSDAEFRFINVQLTGIPCMLSLNPEGAMGLWVGSTDYTAGKRRIWESKGVEATQAPDASGKTHTWITVTLAAQTERALFVSLASYICSHCIASASCSSKVIIEALEDWDLLFQGNSGGLTSNELAGLIGELLTLQELTEIIGDRALDFWQGFEGESQDFRCGELLIETKTSIGHSKTLAINGLRQLVRPESGELLLRHFQLQEDPPLGISLASVIDRLSLLGLKINRLKECILRVGATPKQLNDSSKLFRIMDRKCYLVHAGFPSITDVSFVGGRKPEGITSVKYTIDLTRCTPFILQEVDYLSRIHKL